MSIEAEALRALAPTTVTKATIADTSSDAAALSAGFWMFGVEASDGDGVFVRFGASDVGAATSSNGLHIAAGEKIERYVDGVNVTHFRAIRNGAASEVFFYAKTGD